MKKCIILLLICLLALPALSIARKKYRSAEDDGPHYISHSSNHYRNVCNIIDDAFVTFEDDKIYIFSDYFDEEIKVTEDAGLYIDGDEVSLTEKQKQLVSTFYAESKDVMELGAKMGELGGKMGAIGGRMGTIGAMIGTRAAFQARASLAASLSEYYDDDDDEKYEEYEEAYEEYMDKLEEKMDRLEEQMEESEDKMDALSDRMDDLGDKMEELGDQMEEETDQMEDAFDAMRDGIPSLEKLDW
ncbi:MAG: hypothetical protein R3F48_16735 [Candidatus Zixiibacteriota bacterium]